MKNDNIADVLRIEGVKSKGYGTVPKVVMTDTDLSLAAKGIYAYFCSLTGKGETTFPGRDKILYDLNISKDAYYKAMQELKDAGYITVTQMKAPNSTFSHNVYTLTAIPSKYTKEPPDPENRSKWLKVAAYGLDIHGYGIVPYAVMSDKRMKYQPKGTYAYLSCFAGTDRLADLKPAAIRYHLGISKPDTLQAHIKQLRELNYVTVERIQKDGRLIDQNRYFLVPLPDETSAQKKLQVLILRTTQVEQHPENPEPEKQDTEKQDPEKQDTEKQDPEKQDMEKQDPEKQDTEKQDTINTSLTNTSLTNTSFTNTSSLTDRQIQRVREKMHTSFLKKISYANRPLEQLALSILENAIEQLFRSENPYCILNGAAVLTSSVKEELLKTDYSDDAVIAVISQFIARMDKVSQPDKYLLTSFMNEIRSPLKYTMMDAE